MPTINKAVITLDVYIDISDIGGSTEKIKEAIERIKLVLTHQLIYDYEIKSVVIQKEVV